MNVSATDERTRRILDAAVQLAETGGFAAVRLRDVAQTSGVALGTVYKRFRSKEELLVGVLGAKVTALRTRLREAPITGDTPLARIVGFFAAITEFLCERPNFGRAVVRSSSSGDPAMSERLAQFNYVMFELGSEALAPGRPLREPEVAMLVALQHVWFAALCAWAGSTYSTAQVGAQVESAARLMMYGVDRLPAVSPIRD